MIYIYLYFFFISNSTVAMFVGTYGGLTQVYPPRLVFDCNNVTVTASFMPLKSKIHITTCVTQ